ncbi:hypothetical protein AA0242T_0208 [Acetobacter aceti NRIC 0242]|uniref:Uncharacterized protein n=1 Tax=Acetobacter aceti NBRC 14818 TaxID=887700 RepID=A0AB33IGB4_ACEAC|nr:hypothetical protein [Acetobacter aceti]TCS34658.1 hypothetical protein EDC15_103268 [Acetobacter aceti NBRC 14818]BCK77083.1 hypothetical protein EMQ_2689 [Acetobacter aceti NBRC 14818]GAN56524.1 hypothetical protein Abac_006_252 [Acetobacter aceti NBRC 14818]GBO79506.1 hypothetical protein AA0242T_0208 [Acetobacter aceti NRIC 0242]
MSGDGTDRLTAASERDFVSALTQAEDDLDKGDIGAVIADCARAFDKWPDIRFLRQTLLKACETANAQERKAICDLLLRTEMRDAAQDADIAAALFNEGRFEEALPLLRDVVHGLKGERFSAWNYIRSLEATGRYDELIDSADFLDELAAAQGGRISLYSQLANARLAKTFQRKILLQDLENAGKSELWLSPDRVGIMIREAVQVGEPFSLVSMGYDEAKIVCATSLHASLLLRPVEMTEMAEAVWQRVSDTAFSDCAPSTQARLGRGYRQGAREAVILCLPSSDILQNDREHFGFFAEQDREVRVGRYKPCAGLDVMPALAAADPGLCSLLGDLPFAGIVTTHEGLASRIAETCRLGTANEVFLQRNGLDEMLTQIDEVWVPYPGAVFLVAAGALGPYACGQIVAKGGIALDVESCVGTWAA